IFINNTSLSIYTSTIPCSIDLLNKSVYQKKRSKVTCKKGIDASHLLPRLLLILFSTMIQPSFHNQHEHLLQVLMYRFVLAIDHALLLYLVSILTPFLSSPHASQKSHPIYAYQSLQLSSKTSDVLLASLYELYLLRLLFHCQNLI